MNLGILKIVPFNEIVPNFEERGRKEYTNIDLLASSISENGLINPLTVRSLTGNAPYILVAGGRRYKACEMLHMKEVSVRIYTEKLNEQQLRMIELYENTKREDLAWPEKLKMTKELNDLFIEVKGTKVARTPAASGHSQRDTAKFIGVSQGKINQDIRLHEAIKKYPELKLQNAKNLTTALHTLNRFESMIKTKVAIAQTPKVKNSTLGNSYILGDFFKNSLKAQTYQFIEADPPYGIDLQSMRSAENKQNLNQNYVEINKKDYAEFQIKLCAEAYRLAAKSAIMILWCGPQWYESGLRALNLAGFYPCIIPAIWKKGNEPGQTFSPATNLGNVYEMFLYARKGDAKFAKQGRANVFDFSGVAHNEGMRIHPTERPVELMKEILKTFCWPESNVLVPFAGSGSTLVAAYELGYKVIGFDISSHFRDEFLHRVIKMEEKK